MGFHSIHTRCPRGTKSSNYSSHSNARAPQYPHFLGVGHPQNLGQWPRFFKAYRRAAPPFKNPVHWGGIWMRFRPPPECIYWNYLSCHSLPYCAMYGTRLLNYLLPLSVYMAPFKDIVLFKVLPNFTWAQVAIFQYCIYSCDLFVCRVCLFLFPTLQILCSWISWEIWNQSGIKPRTTHYFSSTTD